MTEDEEKNGIGSPWKRIWKEKPDRVIELAIAASILGISVVNWHNSKSSSFQTDQLITAAGVSAYAAQQNVAASRSFANSATGINQGVSDAVRRLQAQANATELARESSEASSAKALQATIDNFHQEQRAWLGVCGVELGAFERNRPVSIFIKFCNTGRSPARGIQEALRYRTAYTVIAGPSAQDLQHLTYIHSTSVAPAGSYTLRGGGGVIIPDRPEEIQGQNALIKNFSEIQSGRQILYYGTFRYKDAFGMTRHTEFCVFLANPDTKEINYCDAHNDLD